MEQARAALRGEKITKSDLPECLSCSFGAWYKQQDRPDPARAEPHNRIHALAEQVVTLCAEGDRGAAERLYREMERMTEQISLQLDRVKKGDGEATLPA